jgi:hypothetical protein
MIFPVWAFFGIGTAVLSAGMMLLQEGFRVNGYALAFWIKVACVLVTLPFVLTHGIPQDKLFYFYLALTAVLYAISDVVFFTGITKTGAGAVARLVPSASVLSFLLWFVIDPALLAKYMNAPAILLLIFLTLCLFAFFAFRLKRCPITMNTIRAVWFVIFAATTGPLLTKLTTFYADRDVAIYSYVFFQALMMMGLWLGWLFIRKPVPLSVFFSKDSCHKGLAVGAVAAAMVLMKFTSYYYVDNPAYIPAIIALDSVIILFVYKWRGQKIEGDVLSGLGIVACAVALIILKAQI